MGQHFGDLLKELAEREQRTAGQLAELSEVPLKTIQSWLEGRVRKPRAWQPIVEVAKALHLSVSDVNQLLDVAGHRTLDKLHQQAEKNRDQAALKLLAFWPTDAALPPATSPSVIPQTPPPDRLSVFQAVPAPTNLVGRDTEFAQLRTALLAGQRLCVLRGMPGVGKTVLAAQAAYELREHFPDGVLWAQLDKSPALEILHTFASAYGRDVGEYQDIGTRSAVVRDIFAHKRALIVLDSPFTIDEIRPLLPPSTSPSAVIITTTNRRVLADEALIIEIKPFAVDEPTAGLTLFSHIMGTERTQLEREGLVRLMQLVGGLPLALRMIASDLAQSDYLTVAEYAELLQNERTRLENLSDWNDASKDVRASFAVSYGRLRPELQKLFASFAVFKKAEFSVAAVAQVMETPLPQLKRQLDQLQALSLVEAYRLTDLTLPIPTDTSERATHERYRLHGLLALFAAEQVAATDLVQHQARASDYYAALAERHRHHYKLLAIEWENLAELFNGVIQRQDWALFQMGLDALTTLNLGVLGFLDAQGHWRQAQSWLHQALALPELTGDKLRHATLAFKAGMFALRLAQSADAETYLQQALTLLAAQPRQPISLLYQGYVCDALAQLEQMRNLPAALAWSQRGVTALQAVTVLSTQQEVGYLQIRHATILARSGDLEPARSLIETALQLLPPSEPTAARISGLLTLGNIYDLKGQTDPARACWQEGVTLAEALGDNRRLAGLWLNLAIQAEEQGHFTASVEHNQRALQLYQRIGDVDGEGRALSNLAFTHLRQEETEAALPYLQAAKQLTLTHELDDLAIHVQVNYAQWHLLRGELVQAQSLLEQALGLSDRLGESEALAEILRLLGRVALQRREYRQALIWSEEAISASEEQSSEAGLAWGLKGEILSKLGEIVQAEAAFQRSVELLVGHLFDLAKAQVAWAGHYLTQQVIVQARSLLTKARTTFQQLQIQHEIERIEIMMKHCP